MSAWRPIESAPKDGTAILGWRFYPVAIRWRPDLDHIYPWDAVSLDSHPSTNFAPNGFVDGDKSLTHWMPLPAPPTDELDGLGINNAPTPDAPVEESEE